MDGYIYDIYTHTHTHTFPIHGTDVCFIINSVFGSCEIQIRHIDFSFFSVRSQKHYRHRNRWWVREKRSGWDTLDFKYRRVLRTIIKIIINLAPWIFFLLQCFEWTVLHTFTDCDINRVWGEVLMKIRATFAPSAFIFSPFRPHFFTCQQGYYPENT